MKYKKRTGIRRVPIGGMVRTHRKPYLSPAEVSALLRGPVVVEEKLDGRSESWTVAGHVVYGEFLKHRHSVWYLELPACRVAFDVWTGSSWLGRSEKEAFCKTQGLACAPLVFQGELDGVEALPGFLGIPSAFSSGGKAEGVVVKNYQTCVFGKVVDPDFEAGIGEYWVKKWKTRSDALNRLRFHY